MTADQSRPRIEACDDLTASLNEETRCEPSCHGQEGEAHACRDVALWISLLKAEERRRRGSPGTGLPSRRRAEAGSKRTADSEGGQGMAAALPEADGRTLLSVR